MNDNLENTIKYRNKKRNAIIYSILGVLVLSFSIYYFYSKTQAGSSDIDYEKICENINTQSGFGGLGGQRMGESGELPDNFQPPEGFESGQRPNLGGRADDDSSMKFMSEIVTACEDGDISLSEKKKLDQLTEDLPDNFLDRFLNNERPERLDNINNSSENSI